MNLICDECADSKSLVASCNEAQPETIYRYPSKFRGEKDPAMLPHMLSGDRTLLTSNAFIAEEHASAIPLQNPGIVVVRLRRPSKTMTAKMIKEIIARFKAIIPEWRGINLNNIHLEICEDCAIISSLPLKGERAVIYYRSAAFKDDLNAALRRFATQLPSS